MLTTCQLQIVFSFEVKTRIWVQFMIKFWLFFFYFSLVFPSVDQPKSFPPRLFRNYIKHVLTNIQQRIWFSLFEVLVLWLITSRSGLCVCIFVSLHVYLIVERLVHVYLGETSWTKQLNGHLGSINSWNLCYKLKWNKQLLFIETLQMKEGSNSFIWSMEGITKPNICAVL